MQTSSSGMASNGNADSEAAFVLKVRERLADVSPDQWAALTGASKTARDSAYNPFLSHAFLTSLEESGSATSNSGWLGQHLTLEDGAGRIRAAAPCYLKSHSQGEYVFDYAWADAYERAGGRYYPKLQCSVPFTPATGPRLLVGEGLDEASARAALAGGIRTLTEKLGISSAHVTFAQKTDITALEESGFLHRTDQQFHFHNEGYADFSEFTANLASRKRKNIRKERETARGGDIEIVWLTGNDITEEAMDAFFEFYMDTGSRKWGQPYLNRWFYALIQERMADDILLVMARRAGRYVAGAINFIGGDRLFGRHWGCIEDHPCLHFEICYYQAIEFAIEHGLTYVEAGAQGQHKLARGYMPVTTHSAHYLPNESFRDAVADYLDHERDEVARFGEVLTDHGPFRKSNR